ncbi:aldehyde dehydrogenase family protein [Pigmentiphaga kullae]|uniref:Acyl-CoA reductase-like NAD-dependent aldehyde dehydrogenase n=1 Tax=Pigmentiphaga kullae TaxID=151784 RepID=A0A4Q7NHQ1_9BURK|nr:aldehyde dehydrogenase family protein [Pigmentiphaga kullae]RZS84396.1 acyl-CoA reductase-like NAD-dependent aldehyde dehydrogenase [Pigmentiphaga kullae]
MKAEAYTHTINGTGESSPERIGVIDPSRGSVFAQCPSASQEQLARAVEAARASSGNWQRLGFDGRRVYLEKFAAALRDSIETLTPMLTQEQGKPLDQSRAEILRAAESTPRLCGLTVEDEVLNDTPTERVELRHRPLGVVGVISPWNAPIGLAVLRMAQALYAGNTVVAKPSPYTPLTTLKVGEIARGIFPAGTVNVVAGGDDLGRWMTEHPGIDKISFTGSVRTGKRVMASAAASLKRVTLELGGNDPAIVLPDVDLKQTAHQIFWTAFRNSGQICMAIKRLFVHEEIYEPMIEELAAIARGAKVGDGTEPGVDFGPLQNRMQFDIVSSLLADTRGLPGVRIATGGAPLDRPGYFVPPTIVADIADDTRLVREEPFGPVLPVLKFSDIDDAIARANDTRYGLGASVWSKDLDTARAIADRLEAGTTWINCHLVSDVHTPFGGCKESGLGRANSVFGIKEDMEMNVLRIRKAA